jgi:polyphenol oxidase
MNNYIRAAWPTPKNVKAYTTKRTGGVSTSPYNSFNFSLLTGDDKKNVLTNRKKIIQELNLPQEPFWLKQEHTDIAICIEKNIEPIPVVADASFTRIAGSVCVVMTADCVPILVCDQKGSIVAAIHAGWKGIANGIIASTIKEMDIDPTRLLAWLGPAIGPNAFTVSQDVHDIFCKQIPECKSAFISKDGAFITNIYSLASIYLEQVGITKIYGGDYCTFTQKDLFFSYRRDGEKSGRMANLIWLEPV